MRLIKASTSKLIVALLLTLLSFGCGGGGDGGFSASEQPAQAATTNRGTLNFTVNTGIIPQAIAAQTTGVPDSIVVDILDASTRESVHPQTVFVFSRTLTVQSFSIPQVQTGSLIVRIQIFDSTGASFFEAEQAAVLTTNGPTTVQFTFGDNGGNTTTPSVAVRVVEFADDEQGHPDVDMAEDGYFFVACRVTDASDQMANEDFDDYGFIHGERFEATFDGQAPVSLDENNGNNGDFDLSQFDTMNALTGGGEFDQEPVFPRVSVNDSRTAVIAWLDSVPHSFAGDTVISFPPPGAPVAMNFFRQPIIRSVILGPTSITTPNVAGNTEPEFFNPPGNVVLNLAGPMAGLGQPSVSMTNAPDGGGNAIIDLSFFSTTLQSPRAVDGGVSEAGVPANGAPVVLESVNNITAVFNQLVDVEVANRKTVLGNPVYCGRDISQSNRVAAEVATLAANPFVIVNQGQPSEAEPTDEVRDVSVDQFENGNIAFVYSVLDVSVGGSGLYARCFNEDLSTPLGPEFQIAAPAPGVDNLSSDVAVVNDDGTILVTWTQNDNGVSEALLQRFNCATGAATPAAPIVIAAGETDPEITAGENQFSRVACTNSGNAVVVWQTGFPQIDTFNVRAFAKVYPNGSTNQ